MKKRLLVNRGTRVQNGVEEHTVKVKSLEA